MSTPENEYEKDEMKASDSDTETGDAATASAPFAEDRRRDSDVTASAQRMAFRERRRTDRDARRTEKEARAKDKADAKSQKSEEAEMTAEEQETAMAKAQAEREIARNATEAARLHAEAEERVAREKAAIAEAERLAKEKEEKERAAKEAAEKQQGDKEASAAQAATTPVFEYVEEQTTETDDSTVGKTEEKAKETVEPTIERFETPAREQEEVTVEKVEEPQEAVTPEDSIGDSEKANAPLPLSSRRRAVLDRQIHSFYFKGVAAGHAMRTERRHDLLDARLDVALSSRDRASLLRQLTKEGKQDKLLDKLALERERFERDCIVGRMKKDGGIALTPGEEKKLARQEKAYAEAQEKLRGEADKILSDLDEQISALENQQKGPAYTITALAARRTASQQLSFLRQRREDVALRAGLTPFEEYCDGLMQEKAYVDPVQRYVQRQKDRELEAYTPESIKTQEPAEKAAEKAEEPKEQTVEKVKETEERTTERSKETEERTETQPKETEAPTVEDAERASKGAFASAQKPQEPYHRPVSHEKLRSAANYRPSFREQQANRAKEHSRVPALQRGEDTKHKTAGEMERGSR